MGFQEPNGRKSQCRSQQSSSGYCQEEGIDYEETFSPIAHLKEIHMFLA